MRNETEIGTWIDNTNSTTGIDGKQSNQVILFIVNFFFALKK